MPEGFVSYGNSFSKKKERQCKLVLIPRYIEVHGEVTHFAVAGHVYFSGQHQNKTDGRSFSHTSKQLGNIAA